MQKLSRRVWLLEGLMPAALWGLGVRPGRAAELTWIDQRSAGPFMCRANFRMSDYDGLFGELAQLQLDLTRTLGVQATREPVVRQSL